MAVVESSGEEASGRGDERGGMKGRRGE